MVLLSTRDRLRGGALSLSSFSSFSGVSGVSKMLLSAQDRFREGAPFSLSSTKMLLSARDRFREGPPPLSLSSTKMLLSAQDRFREGAPFSVSSSKMSISISSSQSGSSGVRGVTKTMVSDQDGFREGAPSSGVAAVATGATAAAARLRLSFFSLLSLHAKQPCRKKQK